MLSAIEEYDEADKGIEEQLSIVLATHGHAATIPAAYSLHIKMQMEQLKQEYSVLNYYTIGWVDLILAVPYIKIGQY